VAGIADDLAFFGHHGVAALGAGVEKLLGFIGIAFAFGDSAQRQKRGKRFNHGLGFFITHGFTLARGFSFVQAV